MVCCCKENGFSPSPFPSCARFDLARLSPFPGLASHSQLLPLLWKCTFPGSQIPRCWLLTPSSSSGSQATFLLQPPGFSGVTELFCGILGPNPHLLPPRSFQERQKRVEGDAQPVLAPVLIQLSEFPAERTVELRIFPRSFPKLWRANPCGSPCPCTTPNKPNPPPFSREGRALLGNSPGPSRRVPPVPPRRDLPEQGSAWEEAPPGFKPGLGVARLYLGLLCALIAACRAREPGWALGSQGLFHILWV